VNLSERLNKFQATDIYPVITPEFCKGRSPVDVLQAALKGGAKIVQLRDKADPSRYSADFRKLTDKYGALLIVNDSLETALKCGADGVHLGADDLPVAEARKMAPDLLIGASSHSFEEALAAQNAGASYVNIGPIFPTKTKTGVKDFLGVGAIAGIAPKLSVPFSVMGGINRENIHEVLAAGGRHIAMVTAVTEARDVEKAVREFIQIIKSVEAPAKSS